MKRILLLFPLLFLCSCGGGRTLNKVYKINSTNEDNYIYSCNIDSESGSLLLNRYIGGEKPAVYKSYILGNYQIVYSSSAPLLYDYGEYAIWQTVNAVLY